MNWKQRSNGNWIADDDGVRLTYLLTRTPDWAEEQDRFGPWVLEAEEPGDKIIIADGSDRQALMVLGDKMQALIEAFYFPLTSCGAIAPDKEGAP